MNGFIFNRKKVKYSIMNSLLSDYHINDESVDLYIDNNYIIDIFGLDFYKKTNQLTECTKNSNDFVGEYINLISHYRKFFIDYLNVKSIRIFILFDDTSVQDKYKETYDLSYKLKTINDIHLNKFSKFIYKKVQTVTNLLVDVYTIYSGNIENTVIPEVILSSPKFKPSKHSLFISNNPLFHQYNEILNNILVFHATSEHSKVISKNRYFEYLYKKYKYSIKDESELITNDSYIKLYLNLTGYESTHSISTNKNAINIINTLKKVNSTFDGKYSAIESDKLDEDQLIIMSERSCNYDIFSHSSLLDDVERLNIINQLEYANLRDRKEFSHLNDKYFNNSLVHIDSLFTL